MPFDYYSMPFCKPPEGVKKSSGTINPGTILLGIRIENSPYNLSMNVSERALSVGILRLLDFYKHAKLTRILPFPLKYMLDRVPYSVGVQRRCLPRWLLPGFEQSRIEEPPG
jgi:transmembrane 9 superfamily protein 2/4